MRYFYEPNDELTASIDKFFALLAEVNQTKYQGRLSLMLLGSLSRGEGSWGMENGRIVMYSDIEFFTVVPAGFNRHREFDEDIAECSRMCLAEYESELFHIDNTFLNVEAMAHIERKVLTFDAKATAKMVFGKDCISLLPEITFSNINQEDIWDVLVHRMFYVAYYGQNYKHQGNEEGYRYTIAKNSLDLMTVVLAKHGRLIAGFKNKLEALKKLGTSLQLCDYFEYCLKIKLRIQPEREYAIAEMEHIFVNLVKELSGGFAISFGNRLTNADVHIRRRMGIIKRMIQQQTLTFGRSHFLKTLINKFEKNEQLSATDVKISYVLNGYPKC